MLVSGVGADVDGMTRHEQEGQPLLKHAWYKHQTIRLETWLPLSAALVWGHVRYLSQTNVNAGVRRGHHSFGGKVT
jgi:hypothetical protein